MSFEVEIIDNLCPHCHRSDHVWSWDGMTYNLAPMFRKAGFYEAIEAPFNRYLERLHAGEEGVENEGVSVAEILPLVRAGLEDMELHPEAYRELDPPNKWGDYTGALEFTKSLLGACEQHPNGRLYFSG